ncbi:MAG: NAD(P)-dependent alcohol dehydrogenase [Solirubrobacterales bacterium]|nr:NAD(P)-dependent alcohol dehydrogenase [Solirubrobacterales bacterium]
MLAYQLTGWQQPPQLREVPVPEPGPGQVLLKVAGAGACHSDLHLMEWPEGTMAFDLPFTLGHENAGWVAALGAGVEGLAEGDAVAVYGPWGCGRCRACRLSREDYCERQAEIGAFGGGLGLDGGMAEYLLVPHSRLLIPLGDLDPRDAAPLTDAGLTPYHAIKRSLHLLHPGSTAVVIGVGGLGHMAVQMLAALSPARIVAVDAAPDKLAVAGEIGADATFEPGEETATAIRELTGGRGAELVLDVVGADATLELARSVVGFEGHLTVIGLAGGKIDYDWTALPWAAQLTATYWGTAVELMDVLALASAGKIHVRVQRFGLDRVEEAYARLRAGEVDGRAVICPNG